MTTNFIVNENLDKERKHHDPKGWIKCYYYHDYKKTFIKKKKIVNIPIDTIKYFKKGIFYKLTQSNNDELFNYYKVLKPYIKENQYLPFKRTKKQRKKKFQSKIMVKDYSKNPFILHFD